MFALLKHNEQQAQEQIRRMFRRIQHHLSGGRSVFLDITYEV